MELGNLLIPLLVLVPTFTGIALLAPVPVFDERRSVWAFALGSALVTLSLSLVLLAQLDWTNPSLQFTAGLPWVSAFGLAFAWGVDGISVWLVLLSTLLTPLVVLLAPGQEGSRPRQFYFWILMVQAGMIAAFVATDVLFFFLCFEFTLIPLYFLIGIYGGSERGTAARLFFIYTFTGSMFTFAGLLYVAWFAAQLNQGVWSFAFVDLMTAAQQMSLQQQGWVLAALLAGFAVKVPIFPLHTWLPITYVEAPYAGTVILSAVLAKLGTYALIRFAIPFCPEAVAVAAPWIAVFAVIGIVYAALICWVQKDAKKLVAYSSISHLGFCTMGLFALDAENLGAVGGVLYMLNHGLATGALFLCLSILHNRFRTTEMNDLSGVVRVMPAWAFFMVFFVMASVGLPGLNGFVSEFLTLVGAFVSAQVLGPSYAIAAGLALIFGAIYLLYMVGKIVFGPVRLPPTEDGRPPQDLNGREWAALAPLAAVVVVLGLFPTPVLRSIEAPVSVMTAAARTAASQPIVAAAEAGSPALVQAAFDVEGG